MLALMPTILAADNDVPYNGWVGRDGNKYGVMISHQWQVLQLITGGFTPIVLLGIPQSSSEQESAAARIQRAKNSFMPATICKPATLAAI